MDSINKQQEEENHKDLQGSEAGQKIKELASKNNTCFFCTGITTGKPVTVRPMAVQKVDDEGSFWFLSANDSHKNLDIQNDNKVQLLFQGSAHSDFLSIYGEATISTDKELIKELWEPIIKTWFTGGLYDLVLKGKDKGHYINKGDVIVFASVGAGMNINAVCYRV